MAEESGKHEAYRILGAHFGGQGPQYTFFCSVCRTPWPCRVVYPLAVTDKAGDK